MAREAPGSPGGLNPGPAFVPGQTTLDTTAVSPEDADLLQRFCETLNNERMELCLRCRHRWFSMDLKHDVCKSCRSKDSGKPPESLFFYSAENLDFGDVPAHLEPLTQVEEMFIARLHVHVQVFFIRGALFKYRGHFVNFLRDVGKVYSQLPRLPEELDVILLRPKNTSNHPHLQRQFRRDFV